MGSTRDFIAATLADAMMPSFRRPVEDIIYETLDRRQVPSQNDFKDVRQLLNALDEEATDRRQALRKLGEHIDRIEQRMSRLEDAVRATQQLGARLARLEANTVSAAQLDARLDAFRAAIPPAGVTKAQLDAALTRLETLTQTTITEKLEERAVLVDPLQGMVAAPIPEPPSDQCKVPGCEKTIRARGFCAQHYQRWRRGSLDDQFISIDGEATLNGEKVKVDPDLAGEPYVIREGAVYVQDKKVH
ncbi:MAG: hypothetical protein AAFV53_41175 [Myxococcota bacterium]